MGVESKIEPITDWAWNEFQAGDIVQVYMIRDVMNPSELKMNDPANDSEIAPFLAKNPKYDWRLFFESVIFNQVYGEDESPRPILSIYTPGLDEHDVMVVPLRFFVDMIEGPEIAICIKDKSDIEEAFYDSYFLSGIAGSN